MRIKKIICVYMMCLFFLGGCAGLEVAMENSKVQVVSNLDNVPFFDSHPGQKVFIDIKNFSNYKELDQINNLVIQKYQKRGFKIVNDPNMADWVVQAKIVNITKNDIPAREVKGVDSAGAAITGGGVGAMAGGMLGGNSRDVLAGALIGGILSGASSLTVDSWVKLGYLTIVTDIQVKERKRVKVQTQITSTQKVGNVEQKYRMQGSTNWIKYRFQALTRAKKANLKWKDCRDAMVDEISRILASLL